MRAAAFFRTVAVAALLVGAACGSESAAAVARIKISQKIRSRVGATQQGLLSGGAGSSLGCHEKCGKKCKASSDCKDDSCNYDSYYCKNNHQCHWNDGKKRCKGKISVSPTSAPTVYPTTAPTVPTMSPTVTSVSKYAILLAKLYQQVNETGFYLQYNATTQTGYLSRCTASADLTTADFQFGVQVNGNEVSWGDTLTLHLFLEDALLDSDVDQTSAMSMPGSECLVTVASTTSTGVAITHQVIAATAWKANAVSWYDAVAQVQSMMQTAAQSASEGTAGSTVVEIEMTPLNSKWTIHGMSTAGLEAILNQFLVGATETASNIAISYGITRVSYFYLAAISVASNPTEVMLQGVLVPPDFAASGYSWRRGAWIQVQRMASAYVGWGLDSWLETEVSHDLRFWASAYDAEITAGCDESELTELTWASNGSLRAYVLTSELLSFVRGFGYDDLNTFATAVTAATVAALRFTITTLN